MPEYNKLVRDKIPQIIKSAGKTPVTRVLNKEEYEEALLRKLLEEASEFARTPNDEELADIMEVIEAIMAVKDMSWESVAKVRRDKREKRGAFCDRIFLEKVVE